MNDSASGTVLRAGGTAVRGRPRSGRIVVSDDDLQGRVAALGQGDHRRLRRPAAAARRGAQGRLPVHERPGPRASTCPSRSTSWRCRPTGSATKTSGVVRIIKDLDADLTGRHVLIVEDIVDSGLTLAYLRKNLAARNPASLEVCSLLVKEGLQKVDPDLRYVGLPHPARASSSATGSTSTSATGTSRSSPSTPNPT